MTEVFIGLGSNVGDRLAFIDRAIVEMRSLGPVTVSSVYETEPLGPPQDRFLNAVARLETSLAARSLFDELKRIETSLGRVPRTRWGPREIDLDLLLYGDEAIDEPDLKVPHPEMTSRAFVLVPLIEIAPDVRLPDGQRLTGLLHSSDTSVVRAVGGRGGALLPNQDETQRNM